MSKKIKVLVIVGSFPTKVNPSAAIFVLNQLEILKKFCEFKVIVPYAYVPSIRYFNPFYKYYGVPFKEKIKGIGVYRPRYLQISRFFLFNSLLRSMAMLMEAANIYFTALPIIKKLEKEWEFDIIHIHGPISEGIIGSYVKKKYGKPLVITFHGEDVTVLSKMRLLKNVYINTLRNCNSLIFVTGYLREVLNEKLPDNKVFIIPSGYMVKRFRPLNKDRCMQILNLPKDKKIILFVGGLAERKGPEYLIKSIYLALKKRKDIACWIVGGGKLMKSLKNMTHEMKLDGFVNFAGYRLPDEIPLWMNASDLLVLPSLDEGLPNVVVESLACGKPVVATNVPGNLEVINKDVGYLVKPKDENDLAEKIIMALDKKWKKEKLLERAKKFSVTSSAKRLLDVYKSLLKN